MMTIPDFSWQPSSLEGRPTPPLDDAGHRSDAACVSSTLKPSPTVERSGYAKWLDAARQHRNRIAVLVRGTSAMIDHFVGSRPAIVIGFPSVEWRLRSFG